MLIGLRILLYIICGIIALQILGCSLQRMVLFPRYMIPSDQQLKPKGYVTVLTIDTEEGPVEAWFMPAEQASATNPCPLLIFAHGNCELIDQWQYEMEAYRQRGINVLLPEYRGYGRSAGSPSQEKITRDFVQFHDLISQREDVDSSRIIFHGRSVGGGVVASLATQRRPAAMILQSTFTSVPAIARRYLILPLFIRDKFDVKAAVANYDGPLLVMHGDVDEIISVSHARKLHEAAPNSTLIIYKGIDHNTLPPEEQYWQDIEDFLVNAQMID